MKTRLLFKAPLLQATSAGRRAPASAVIFPSHVPSRPASSGISQRQGASHVSFPGAVKSAFTSKLQFALASESPSLPTYRVVDQDGQIVDADFKVDISDEEVETLYRNMLLISIMDVIMFDAQRQGRLSFYMVSAGEEAISIGSASVLEKEDVVFCQYREQGVFRQRGFELSDFMNQLFANKKDPGRGRNMPVHYGSKELNIVSCSLLRDETHFHGNGSRLTLDNSTQYPAHWQHRYLMPAEPPTH